MPNGHRRAHTVTRNGRTFQRSGSTIRMPMGHRGLACVGIVAASVALVGGTPLAAHPFVLVGALGAITAVLVLSNPTGRRAIKRGVWKLRRKMKQAKRRPQPGSRIGSSPARSNSKPRQLDVRQPEPWGPPEHGSSRLLS